MREITIRQFSINLFKELENLPVTITRYGKPVCVVNSLGPISQGVPIGKTINKFKNKVDLGKKVENLLDPDKPAIDKNKSIVFE